MKRSNFNK